MKAPGHVAILGLGPTLEAYVDHVKRFGGRHRFCDEVWAVNAVAGVLQHDRVFHMDDVEVQERRAEAAPNGNIAGMVDWLRVHPGPIYTSRAVDGYPGLVEFPLEDVVNNLGFCYFNSTAAYAVAYAIHIGVRQVSIFGFDFAYANTSHAEMGRACVEFWMGVGSARGVKFALPAATSLMDACLGHPAQPYGYDAHRITLEHDETAGRVRIAKEPRDLPTAEEIEARYDHSKPANPMLRDDLERTT